MATYSSYKELVGTVLTLKDDIKFKVKEEIYLYRVYSNHLSCKNKAENDIIFTALNISYKNAFAAHIYGYTVCSGTGMTCWPEYNPNDYIAATNIVLTLFKLCEDYNKKYTKKESVLSERKPLYKVGDKVIVKDQYDSEYGMLDYPCVFIPEMLKKYGGKKVTIAKVEPTIFDYKYRKFYKEDYQYKIKEDSGSWNWSASMFKDKAEETTTVEEESYEVGDFVKITSVHNPANCPPGLLKVMVDKYGGQWCRIKGFGSTGLGKEWILLESTDGVPIPYSWTKEMFSEHRKVLIESPYKKDILVDVSNSSDSDSVIEELKRKYLISIKKETVKKIEEEAIQEKPFTIPLSYEEVKLSLKKPVCKF